MAKQTINIGTAPNDGTGDTARDAFDICNDNFTELYDGKLALDGSTEMTGDLVFTEKADHSSTPGAGKGYLWVKSDTPSSLIFTDDAGTDYDLTDISGGAFTADAQTQITPSTPIVLDEATGDEVALDLSYTVNKATSGNDTGLLINQTDTASPGTSLFIEAQRNGATRFGIRNLDGAIGINGVPFSTNTPTLTASTGDLGALLVYDGLAPKIRLGGNYALLAGSADAIGWSTNVNSANPDLTLYRDAANTLALRNGTNAQTFNIYGTYTDSSNYERLAITGSAITVQTAGTGTDDIDLTLTPAGAGNVKFGTHSAISAETVTGYITIKDSSGTTRKLAVVS